MAERTDIQTFLDAATWKAAKFEAFDPKAVAMRVFNLPAGSFVYAPEGGKVTRTAHVVRIDVPAGTRGLRRWYFGQIDSSGAPPVTAPGTMIGRTYLNGSTGQAVPLAVSLEEIDGAGRVSKPDPIKWLEAEKASFPGFVNVRQGGVEATEEGPAAAVQATPKPEKLSPTPAASAAPPPVLYQTPGPLSPTGRQVPPMVWVVGAAGVGLILWGLSRGGRRR